MPKTERFIRDAGQYTDAICDNSCQGECWSENLTGEDHPRYSGGRTEFPENWSKIREKVIERDSEKCQRCGIKRENHISEKNIDLDVHHKMPRKEFIEQYGSVELANEMDNLVTLCRSCHMEVE